MKRFISAITLIFIAFSGISQGGYIKPNNSYGTVMNRLRPDSTLLIPTGNGAPSGLLSTRSTFQRMAAIYNDSTNKQTYIFNPKDTTWSLLGGGGSGNYVDSNTVSNDSLFYWIAGTPTFVTTLSSGGGTTERFDTIDCDIYIYSQDTLRAILPRPNGLLPFTGVVSYTGTGFSFFVTAATYRLQCDSYQTNDTTITLPASDPSLPRFDMIYVDTTGTVRVRSGDAAASPAQPGHDSEHEIPLTYVLVPAGGTTPTITTEVIYNENTEWTTGTGGTITADFDNTTSPFLGSKNVSTTGVANNAYLEFTRSTPFSINDKDGLVVFIRLKGTLSNSPGNTQNIRVQFYNGSAPVGNLVTIPLRKTSLAWQGHTITTSALGVGVSAVNKLRVIYAGNATYTAGFNLDYTYLQNGIASITGDVILVGDISGTGALGSPVSTTLSNTGVSPGTYGTADSVGQFTVDAKGRLTFAGNVAITPTDSSTFATNYRLDSAKQNIRADINLKLNISDTSGMLLPYQHWTQGYVNTAGARAAISLTATGTSGAATYNSTTGVINVPEYSVGGANTTVAHFNASGNLEGDLNFIYTKPTDQYAIQVGRATTGNTSASINAVGSGTGVLAGGVNILANQYLAGETSYTRYGAWRLRNDNLFELVTTGSGGSPNSALTVDITNGFLRDFTIGNATNKIYSDFNSGSNSTYWRFQRGTFIGAFGIYSGSNFNNLTTNSVVIAPNTNGQSIGMTTTSTSGQIYFATNNWQARMVVSGTNSNVGIGTTTPVVSAMLDVQSTTKGLRFPNMTSAQRNAISSPAVGLTAYNTTDNTIDVYTTAWYNQPNGLKASATLDFANTTTATSADLTITVTGAAVGDIVLLGTPVQVANSTYTAFVSAANTVTVRLNNYSTGSVDPASATFKVYVIKN